MIFVTVGAQMPFDRMVRTVDEWAGLRERTDVFAQIGLSKYRPTHIPYSSLMEPGQFYARIQSADTVVAHAGMGTIISAVEWHKPILVMPRLSELGETRNDHQVATARQFEALRLVQVAMDEKALVTKLDEIDRMRAVAGASNRAASRCAMCPFIDKAGACPERYPNGACPHLLAAVKAFVSEERLPPELQAAMAAAPLLT